MRRYFVMGAPWYPFIANDPIAWLKSLARLVALGPARCFGAHIAPARLAQLEHVLRCAQRQRFSPAQP
jgi:hypothetical protein